jgi:hypothetical protein
MIAIGPHTASQSTSDVASWASAALTTAATGSGFFVAFAAYMMGTATGATVTDNKGNTYAQVGAFLTEGATFSGVFYCAGGAGGADHVFTVNLTGATGYVALIVCEVLGSAGPPDQVAGWQLDTTQPMTSALSGTTGQADELALCFAMTTFGGGTEVLTWGGTPAFTGLEGLGDSNYQTAGLGYAVLSASGTVQASTTSSLGSTGALFVATFKASAGGVTNAVQALSATVAGLGLVGKAGKVVRKTTAPITASVARARIKALTLSKTLGIVATRTRRASDTQAAGVGVGATALRAVHVDLTSLFLPLAALTRRVGADLAASLSLGARLAGLGLRTLTLVASLGLGAAFKRAAAATRAGPAHIEAAVARRPGVVVRAGAALVGWIVAGQNAIDMARVLSASIGVMGWASSGAALTQAAQLSINAGVTRMVGVVHVFRATATAAVAKVPVLVRQASTVITAQFGEDAPAAPLVNAEADVIALLRDWPGLATVVTGIFLNAADEAQPLPYIVVTGTHDRQLLLTGELDLDHVTFTVVAWATGAAVAEAIADEVQDALDADDTYAVLARTGGFDEQTANDASVLTADRWI